MYQTKLLCSAIHLILVIASRRRGNPVFFNPTSQPSNNNVIMKSLCFGFWAGVFPLILYSSSALFYLSLQEVQATKQSRFCLSLRAEGVAILLLSSLTLISNSLIIFHFQSYNFPMSFLNSIKQLEEKHYIGFFLAFISMLGPGVLILYHFRQEQFLSLDFSKIVLLSISMTTPIVLSNVGAILMINDLILKRPTDFYFSFKLGSMLAGMYLYLGFIIVFLTQGDFIDVLTRTFIWNVIAIIVILILAFYLRFKSQKS